MAHSLNFGLTNEQSRSFYIAMTYSRWDTLALRYGLSWQEAFDDFQSLHGIHFNADDEQEAKAKLGNRHSAWSLAQGLFDFAKKKGYFE